MKYKKVRIDATPVCQLKCPSCSTAKGENEAGLGKGYLSADNFRKFLDLNPEVEKIELSNYGEIFLNKELGEIFKIGKEYNVSLTARNGVNLNSARNDILENAVKYGVEHLNVSIDGASQDTYPIYRVNGNFDRVIENIREINRFKKKYNTNLPKLSWQFVVMGHNEHEIPKAKAMAKELGMTFKPKMSWDEVFSPIRDPEFVKKHTGWDYATRSEALAKDRVNHNAPICKQLWHEPQINWDGRVLGCCVNHWGDFGVNAFEVSLNDALSNEKMTYARDMVVGNTPARKDVPCSTCNVYKNMRSTGLYLDREGKRSERISAINII